MVWFTLHYLHIWTKKLTQQNIAPNIFVKKVYDPVVHPCVKKQLLNILKNVLLSILLLFHLLGDEASYTPTKLLFQNIFLYNNLTWLRIYIKWWLFTVLLCLLKD